QAGHVDDAHFLAERLLRNRLARRDGTGDHDGAIAFDHAARAIAGSVGVGLGVARYILDLLAEHAIALQRQRLQRVQDAAIALAVDVLDRKLISLELIQALLRVGTGLRDVEAEDDTAV